MMKLSRSLFISCFLVAVIVKPGQAKEVIKISPIQEPNHFARTVKEWLAQIEQQQTPQTEVVQVTQVKANPTNKGVEVILQTSKGQQLQLVNRSTGSNFITDIPNAQLRLPSGEAFTFRSEKPIAGVSEITVTNFDANTIRVTVIGEVGIPTVELFDSPDEGLIFSVATAASTAQQPQTQPTPEQQPPESQTQPKPSTQGDEPIELVVTGEQDGYRVPDATTATKTDTPLRDIPQSIQVIPRQIIDDQKTIRLRDILQNVSGVTPGAGYQNSFDRVRIRGFTQETTFRDGIRDNFPSTDFANVERVEVLKGPASVLFGQTEPGGIINLVTKQPLSDPYYNLDLDVGNYAFYRSALDLSGPLNTDKTLLYRLNVAYENAGSFRDFISSKNIFVAPVIAWKLSKNTDLNLFLEYNNRDYKPDRGVLAIGDRPGSVPINRFFGEPSINEGTTTNYKFGYNLEHRFSQNWQLRQAFSTNIFKSDEIRVQIDELQADGRTATRDIANFGGTTNEDYRLQTDVIGNFKTGTISHKLLFGVDLNRYTEVSDGFSNGPFASIDVFNPVYFVPITRPTTPYIVQNFTDTLGFYLQDQITIADNLKLLLGGRFDTVNILQKDLVAQSSTNDNNSAFTPRVGIVYQPTPPVSLYASYAESFVPQYGRSRDNSAFVPERSKQYEVGVKGELFDGRLSATLAAYHLTKSNVLTTDPIDSNYSIQVGEQTSKGIELDIVGQLTPGWNVIATYGYTDARVTRDNDLPVGNRLQNVAENTASLWTTYELQQGNFKGLGFGLGLYYVGDRPGEIDKSLILPSYFRTDAALFYKQDNWRVGLNFKNLFDINYYLETQGRDVVYPGAPFTVIGSVSFTF
ncbi:TonB-dependent siderophore receptor [Nostoc sp. PA-18-2419]|uniref:TonB-dependent siderophore receptor n=1 Tax=Nostoc sp. PA-18-2419 TaxID=2575443 RepID=UPI00294FF2A4|nr:TonB-dependent siderophore receptor [Nostoc sp. PA-18-2419]